MVDVPDSWSFTRLKHLSDHIINKRRPVDGEIKISPENVESVTGRITNFYSDYDTEGSEFSCGDILFNKLRVYLNKVVLTTFDGLSMGEMIVVRPRGVDGRFLFNVMTSSWFIEKINSLSEGVKLPRPPVDGIFNVKVPCPPPHEQHLISRYLDKKTEQIDSLIEKIQKKIELLNEQRTSLINHCVTKGLDPNVEMKDSGIEWIGEIPSHWGITKIRFVSSLKEQKNDDGISRGMLSVSQYLGIIPKVYEDESLELTSEESSRYWVVDDNDLVVNTMWLQFCGLGVSFGVTGYVSPDYKVYRLDLEQVVPRFIHHLLRSNRYVDLYSRHLRGIRPNSSRVGTHDFQRFCIPLPPVDEQIEISNYIEKKITYSDVLIEKETHRIELLKEYRQSLISSVVTGKVRVTEDMT